VGKKKSEEPAKADGIQKTGTSLVLRYVIMAGAGLCIGLLAGMLFLHGPGLPGSVTSPAQAIFPDSPDLKPVSTFENGQRYKAGTYNVIVLSGSYREMGRQYGSLMKAELTEEYTIISTQDNTWGYSTQQLRNFSNNAAELLPQRQKEIFSGMAETSGLDPDDIAMIYYGAYFYTSLPDQRHECSFLAVNGNYTRDGSMIVSRNFDLPDAVSVFDPYYVLVVYKPNDGSNSVAAINPAGMRPETLMNNKGLFISDNNGMQSGGDTVRTNRPDYISEFFRFMLDDASTHEMDDDVPATRPNTAIIVNAAGPDAAYSYEETVSHVAQRSGDGFLVATNHFVDPSWQNLSSPDPDSVIRYNNLVNQTVQNKGSIDAEKMMQIRDVMIDNGGATVRDTDFGGVPYTTDLQVVFVPQSRVLWIKVAGSSWQNTDLDALFSR
jgi:hypothetical protein